MELDHLEDDSEERKLLELNKNEETQEKLYNEKRKKASIQNTLSFDEAQELIKKGFKNNIQHEDLWRISDNSRANALYNKFYPRWKRELERPEPSLPRAIVGFFIKRWFFAVTLQVLYGLLGFMNPLLIPYMITYMTDNSVPLYNGILYALAILGSNVVGSVCYYQSIAVAEAIGFQIRSLLLTLAYRKVTTLAPNSATYDSGKLVNVVASDSQFISDTIMIFLIGTAAPIQIAATVGLLSISVGIFTLLTLGVLLIVLPIVGGLGSLFGPIRKLTSAIGDIRLKFTNEVLNNIKTVKFYAWEDSFKRRINETRVAELGKVLKLLIVRSFIFMFMANTTTICTAVIILLYSWYGAELTPNVAFVVVAMFNLLKAQWFWMPLAMAYVGQYKVGLYRIQSFLTQPDIQQINTGPAGTVGVQISRGNFSWKEDKSAACLRDIDFKIKEKELVAVVGPVGSGKSSIIGALLGEAIVMSGEISVSGSIAYAPQVPWIINASVRQNILFGEPYDEQRYRKVLLASALIADLKALSRGDLTEIGERGVNLSGGQKARVSFARALYANRDLYIFDDPLSAVDNQVSNILFDEGIKKLLKNKTVLLVTNQLTVLPQVDKIYCLDEGQVVMQGKYTELLESSEEFRSQMVRSGVVSNDEVVRMETRKVTFVEGLKDAVPALNRKLGFNLNARTAGASLLQRKSTGRALVIASEANLEESDTVSMSTTSKTIDANLDVDDTIELLDAESTSRLLINVPAAAFKELPVHMTQPEKTSNGLISSKVYWYYFQAGGLATFFFMCLFFMLSVGAKVVSSWWLAVWIQGDRGPFGLLDKWTYTVIYACTCAAEFFFNMVGFLLLVQFSYSSSKRLHKSLLNKVLRAPMSFFDTTPIGRIINRFAKELSLIDDILAIQLGQFLVSLFNVFGIFASASFILPYISIAIVPLGLGYGFFQYYYRRTSIQIQRLEASSRAPIFSHFGESFRGASTLRAYGMQNTFVNMCNYFIDHNTAEKFALRHTMKLFNVLLTHTRQLVRHSIGLVGLGTAVFIVLAVLILFRNLLPGFVTPAFVGLALSSLPGLTNTLSNMSQKLVDTETKLNSVERFYEYEQLPQEAPAINEHYRPPSSWPQKGDIEFKDFSFAYTEGGDNVLRKLNIEIGDGDKIGCVGRTGAGKSSLIQALFRINEPAAGTIFIDGVDIRRIGLKDLRMALAIIPQEPTLFIGSIRYNLDPAGDFADDRLWEALDLVKLRKFVQGLPGGLDFEVGEGGSNFSIGQRQLFCLARALIKKTRILLTDEATASVDIITDSKIQAMIRDHFSERTVLTIAHRLNTVMDNTKILVLDKGKVVQYAPPAELVDQRGHFQDLVNAAPNAVELRRLARGTLSVKAKLVEAIEEARSLVRRAQSRLLWVDVKASTDQAQKEV